MQIQLAPRSSEGLANDYEKRNYFAFLMLQFLLLPWPQTTAELADAFFLTGDPRDLKTFSGMLEEVEGKSSTAFENAFNGAIAAAKKKYTLFILWVTRGGGFGHNGGISIKVTDDQRRVAQDQATRPDTDRV